MNYEGSAFHDDFEKGRAAGQLIVDGEAVAFAIDGDERARLPCDADLEVELGGAGNRIVFLSHARRPGWKLFTSDRAILTDPDLVAALAPSGQLSSLRGRRHRGRVLAIGLVVAVVVLCLGLLQLRHPAIRALADQVPVEWEVELGDLGFSQVTGSSRLVTSHNLPEDLAAMASLLLEVIDDNRFEYRFHIAADEAVNAFALPGGNVVINSGLIERVETPEALLGVVAHEIAHVHQRHSIQQLIGRAGTALVAGAVIGSVDSLDAAILGQGAELMTLKNSREHETEADDLGWDYMVRANLRPSGLIECFEVMAGMEGGEDMASALTFLSTHPAIGDRIERLREKWQNLPNKEGFREVPVDFADFKVRLRRALAEGE